jgi:hypothetical protein
MQVITCLRNDFMTGIQLSRGEKASGFINGSLTILTANRF